eukprot:813659-Heterocapsa_arctica.AAC.1
MYGHTRLDIQHEKLRSCVKPEKLKAPGARSIPAGTKGEIAKEKLYTYERDIYTSVWEFPSMPLMRNSTAT